MKQHCSKIKLLTCQKLPVAHLEPVCLCASQPAADKIMHDLHKPTHQVSIIYFRSLSQNSSVLPEEEDEKSCSESEACRHKLAVDQQEVCVCVCETETICCVVSCCLISRILGLYMIVCKLLSHCCSRCFTERSDARQRKSDSLFVWSNRPLILHRDPTVLHHHLPWRYTHVRTHLHTYTHMFVFLYLWGPSLTHCIPFTFAPYHQQILNPNLYSVLGPELTIIYMINYSPDYFYD